MIGVASFEALLEDFAKRGHGAQALGVLFARPQSRISREEIVPHLDYFHHASGGDAHFWCAGYGAYWPPDDEAYRDAQPITTVGDIPWQFSARSFDKVRRAVEKRSVWKYSGAADLVLFGTTLDASGEPTPRLDMAYCIRLEDLLASGTIQSVETFFQSIFSFASRYAGDDFLTAWYASPDLDDLSAIPSAIRHLWRRACLQWTEADYPGVLLSCASVFETVAKHVIGEDAIQNQTLGSFFDKYRKRSNLPQDCLDRILQIYRERGSTPLAAHGSLGVPGITRDYASELMAFTSTCVRTEYRSSVWFVGTAHLTQDAA